MFVAVQSWGHLSFKQDREPCVGQRSTCSEYQSLSSPAQEPLRGQKPLQYAYAGFLPSDIPELQPLCNLVVALSPPS
jgi:hypothetical protein